MLSAFLCCGEQRNHILCLPPVHGTWGPAAGSAVIFGVSPKPSGEGHTAAAVVGGIRRWVEDIWISQKMGTKLHHAPVPLLPHEIIIPSAKGLINSCYVSGSFTVLIYRYKTTCFHGCSYMNLSFGMECVIPIPTGLVTHFRLRHRRSLSCLSPPFSIATVKK